MRASRLAIRTSAAEPDGAVLASHRILERSGAYTPLGDGVVVQGPWLRRVVSRLGALVARELEATGALEVALPVLQDAGLWQRSGRGRIFGRSLLWVGAEGQPRYVLAPAGEEAAAAWAATRVGSRHDLPLRVFELARRFRDEPSPRGGLYGLREHEAAEAHVFCATEEEGAEAAAELDAALARLFAHLGLQTIRATGPALVERLAPVACGEEVVLAEEGSTTWRTLEWATSTPPKWEGGDPAPLRIEATEGIDAGVGVTRTVLAAALQGDQDELWAVLLRAGQEPNLAQLRAWGGFAGVRRLAEAEVEALLGVGSEWAGPVGLPAGVRLVADASLAGATNLVTGVNRRHTVARNVNFGRDLPEPPLAHLHVALPGDAGPGGKVLRARRAVLLAQVAQRGTRYTEAFGVGFSDGHGGVSHARQVSLRLGLTRLVATLVEQQVEQRPADAGIAWPVACAPFQVGVVPGPPGGPAAGAGAEALYAALQATGVDALLDDRPLAMDARIRDLELLGLPFLLVLGRSWQESGAVEVRHRLTGRVLLQSPQLALRELTALARPPR